MILGEFVVYIGELYSLRDKIGIIVSTNQKKYSDVKYVDVYYPHNNKVIPMVLKYLKSLKK